MDGWMDGRSWTNGQTIEIDAIYYSPLKRIKKKNGTSRDETAHRRYHAPRNVHILNKNRCIHLISSTFNGLVLRIFIFIRTYTDHRIAPGEMEKIPFIAPFTRTPKWPNVHTTIDCTIYIFFKCIFHWPFWIDTMACIVVRNGNRHSETETKNGNNSRWDNAPAHAFYYKNGAFGISNALQTSTGRPIAHTYTKKSFEFAAAPILVFRYTFFDLEKHQIGW